MTIPIETILAPSRVKCGLVAASKKRALQQVALHIHDDLPQLGSDVLFEALIAREKLGSTSLGKGVAIPHCRLARCVSVVGALYTLASPVDFNAIDDEPVDILFVLLVPERAEQAHLEILATLARRFENADFRHRLRTTDSDRNLFVRAIEPAEAPG